MFTLHVSCHYRFCRHQIAWKTLGLCGKVPCHGTVSSCTAIAMRIWKMSRSLASRPWKSPQPSSLDSVYHRAAMLPRNGKPMPLGSSSQNASVPQNSPRGLLPYDTPPPPPPPVAPMDPNGPSLLGGQPLLCCVCVGGIHSNDPLHALHQVRSNPSQQP